MPWSYHLQWSSKIPDFINVTAQRIQCSPTVRDSMASDWINQVSPGKPHLVPILITQQNWVYWRHFDNTPSRRTPCLLPTSTALCPAHLIQRLPDFSFAHSFPSVSAHSSFLTSPIFSFFRRSSWLIQLIHQRWTWWEILGWLEGTESQGSKASRRNRPLIKAFNPPLLWGHPTIETCLPYAKSQGALLHHNLRVSKTRPLVPHGSKATTESESSDPMSHSLSRANSFLRLPSSPCSERKGISVQK